MDFLSACWISAVTRSPTLSEWGSGDSSSLPVNIPPARSPKHLHGLEGRAATLSPKFPK